MKNIVTRFLLLLTISISLHAFADGTKEVMPNSANGTALIIDPSINIGSYRSCPSNHRINLRIKDFNTERIYFGLNGRTRQPSTGALTNGFYRIFNPARNCLIYS